MLGVGGEEFWAKHLRCESSALIDADWLWSMACARRGGQSALMIAAGRRLSCGEALRDGDEQILVWTGARQAEADAPGVAPDDGANLQELEADRVSLSAGQLGAGQGQPADRGQQAVSEA